ncbi:MAG TPA: hypothetical protein GX701_03070 [Clostridiales bacterium]|jgi:flagellar hook assembly protein FlgD|nr:hypothetical protein [Clostridiales bacterium]
MEIHNIPAAGRTSAAQAATAAQPAKNGSDLSINDFFRLIAAQLENQSMYDTVDNTQFLSQLAQFTTLTQLTELKETINTNLALTLLGKTVTIEDAGSNGMMESVSGTVEKVSYQNGVPYLYVNGKLYSMDKVSQVG